MSENEFQCPVCGAEPFNNPCEHVVYVAANEGGFSYIAKQYRGQLFSVAESILTERGEIEAGEVVSMDSVPYDIIPDLKDKLGIDNIEYLSEYDMPPSGLAVHAAFIVKQ